jgi:hypothetical protein
MTALAEAHRVDGGEAALHGGRMVAAVITTGRNRSTAPIKTAWRSATPVSRKRLRFDPNQGSGNFGPPSWSSDADIFFPPGSSITRAEAVIGSDFARKPSTVI